MATVKELVHALNKASEPEPLADILKNLTAASVTVAMLHEYKCGAVVSRLRKHEDAGVATLAKALIKQWKGLAAAAGVPATPRGGGVGSPRASGSGGGAKKPTAKGSDAAAASSAAGGSYGVADLGNTMRQNSRKKLTEVLGGSAPAFPAGEAVERVLHDTWPYHATNGDHKRDYVAKLRQLSFNLKKNEDLRKRVVAGDLAAAALCRLSVDELATADVQEERRKMADFQHDARSLDWDKKNRDRVDESIGIDNKLTMYPCGKCKSSKVSNYEKQTRSGDEPMTQFFECADCGNRWRF